MKKLMNLVFGFLMMVVVVACSSSSPSDALKKYASALKESNYEKFVEGVNFPKTNPDKLAEERQGFADMMKGKAENLLARKGGLKDVEVISEEIAEDGNSAVVKFKMIYGNGTESEEEQKMVKVGGEWLMDISK